MPRVRLDDAEKQYVTPKYSTAFGELVTGESLEMGRFQYKAGEGAVAHSHPHEQMTYMLSGRARVEFPEDDESFEVERGDVVWIPSNVLHGVTPIEDCEVISVKNLIRGVGHKIAPGERDRLEELGK